MSDDNEHGNIHRSYFPQTLYEYPLSVSLCTISVYKFLVCKRIINVKVLLMFLSNSLLIKVGGDCVQHHKDVHHDGGGQHHLQDWKIFCNYSNLGPEIFKL